MDAIEFNKTLSEAHSISSKLEHQKKMLTECRNMGFEKHTVKLLHCSLNSINEDRVYNTPKKFRKRVGLKS
jgi:hypothetical protein